MVHTKASADLDRREGVVWLKRLIKPSLFGSPFDETASILDAWQSRCYHNLPHAENKPNDSHPLSKSKYAILAGSKVL